MDEREVLKMCRENGQGEAPFDCALCGNESPTAKRICGLFHVKAQSDIPSLKMAGPTVQEASRMPGSMSLDAVPGLGWGPKEGLECRLSFLSMKCQWRMLRRIQQPDLGRPDCRGHKV